MTEHAGYTQPVPRAEKVRLLFAAIADADKKLATYGSRRDSAIDELTAMGEI